MSPEARRWPKYLLAGALLAMGILGLVQSPEWHGARLPQRYWEMKLEKARWEFKGIDWRLDDIRAVLEQEEDAAQRHPGPGPTATATPGNSGNRFNANGQQFLNAKKEWIDAFMNLRFIEDTMEALERYLERRGRQAGDSARRPAGAVSARMAGEADHGPEWDALTLRAREIRRQVAEYRVELKKLLQRFEALQPNPKLAG